MDVLSGGEKQRIAVSFVAHMIDFIYVGVRIHASDVMPKVQTIHLWKVRQQMSNVMVHSEVLVG